MRNQFFSLTSPNANKRLEANNRAVHQIKLKTPREIGLMREAGRVVARAHAAMKEAIHPGVTTQELADITDAIFKEVGATPLFLNYPHSDTKGPPFPSSLCASVNEEVVHGIPSRNRKLKVGDIISLDIGCRLNGWCGDSAWTHAVGPIASTHQKLLDVCRRSLDMAIELLPKRQRWSEVAREMEKFVRQHGMGSVEKFVGHGIGRDLHEAPQVPNFVNEETRKQDFPLENGLVLAIEPMVSLGTKDVKTLNDHWTIITKDRKFSAHFEHTIAITPSGPEILTLP